MAPTHTRTHAACLNMMHTTCKPPPHHHSPLRMSLSIAFTIGITSFPIFPLGCEVLPIALCIQTCLFFKRKKRVSAHGRGLTSG